MNNRPLGDFERAEMQAAIDEYSKSRPAGTVMILHGRHIDPGAADRMKGTFHLDNVMDRQSSFTYNIDPDLEYYRNLAVSRGRLAKSLGVVAIVLGCVAMFLFALLMEGKP